MKKIYIEISDICGLKCDFCPATKGRRGVMDLATFKKAAFEARRFTRLIALHILGDPLKMENLSEYLQIAKEANLSVEITTSGANLSDFDLLLKAPIKQVNFSLDAIRALKNAPFLMRRICDFCAYKMQKKSEIFINLRIQKRAENREIIEFLAQNLTNILQTSLNLQNLAQNRIKLGNKIIIDFRDVFKWNIEDNAINAESSLDSANFLDSALSTLSTQGANSSIFDEKSGLCSCEREDRTNGSSTKRATNLPDLSQKDAEFGTCLALKTHLGILSNGTIVPCCIDVSGNLALGNIKETSLDSALKSVRAQKMLQGFRENRLIEPFCQKCDYKNRFT